MMDHNTAQEALIPMNIEEVNSLLRELSLGEAGSCIHDYIDSHNELAQLDRVCQWDKKPWELDPSIRASVMLARTKHERLAASARKRALEDRL